MDGAVVPLAPPPLSPPNPQAPLHPEKETPSFAFPPNRHFRYTFAGKYHCRLRSGNHSKASVGIGKETCWIENSS